MKKLFSILFLISAVTLGIAQCSDCRAEVSISSDKQIYSLNEEIRITVLLKNIGTSAFYVPADLTMVSPNGGLLLEMTPVTGSKLVTPTIVADCPPPGCRASQDLLNVLPTKWVLLRPDYSYGVTRKPEAMPLGVGDYLLIAKQLPPTLDDSQTARVKSENIPIFTKILESRALKIHITQR